MFGNRLYLILIGGITVLVLVLFILVLSSGGGAPGSGQRIALTFWGVFDTKNNFEKVIADYRTLYPNISVTYRQFSFDDYERELVNALAAGAGPDIIMVHNTWIPKHQDKLKPAPEMIPGEENRFFTVNDYQNQFVEVAQKDLVKGKDIYAFPLYVDTLALFYNKDLFNNAGLTRPPETWEEFNQYVEVLAETEGSTISKAGAALGTAKNVNRASDILMAMMIQSGVKMNDDQTKRPSFTKSVDGERVGERSLEYYTSFANPKSKAYTWNDSQEYSIDAFVQGKVAMMLNYSHQIGLVRSKASRLNFTVSSMPQANPEDARNYANYWAASVSNKSQNYIEAWKFLRYLTSKNGAIDYLNSSSRPSARRDVIDLQKNDPFYGLFALQALTARSWYQIDNEAIEDIFEEMIDDVNSGRFSVRDALRNAENEINLLTSSRQSEI